MAFHDSLTGLPNRLLLMERIGELITTAECDPRSIVLLFIDLDGFKAVNDLHGHQMGDHVLKVVAGRLAAQVRNSDTVARLGGDEFVVLLDRPDSCENTAVIASRLLAAVNEPIDGYCNVVHVGASIGISVFRGEGQSAAQLLKVANMAMFEAKKAGKNKFVFSRESSGGEPSECGSCLE